MAKAPYVPFKRAFPTDPATSAFERNVQKTLESVGSTLVATRTDIDEISTSIGSGDVGLTAQGGSSIGQNSDGVFFVSSSIYADVSASYLLATPNAELPNALVVTASGGTSITVFDGTMIFSSPTGSAPPVGLGGTHVFTSGSLTYVSSAIYQLSGTVTGEGGITIIQHGPDIIISGSQGSGSGITSLVGEGAVSATVVGNVGYVSASLVTLIAGANVSITNGGGTTYTISATAGSGSGGGGMTGSLAYYGDGSDGIASFDGSSTPAGCTGTGPYNLTRDVYYYSSVIDSGQYVYTQGFRFFCQNILNNQGIITNSGVPGGEARGGGAGGPGGTVASIGGAAAGNGGSGGTNGGGAGNNGTSANVGSSMAYGGAGGNGGNATGGGSGGIGGSATLATAGIYPRAVAEVELVQVAVYGTGSANWQYCAGGAGGGGGAGFGGTGNSGGGGGGGGVVLVSTQVLQGNGTISADGGNGGNATAANGPGGGGGGGLICIIYGDQSAWTGAIHANGGAAGVGGGGTATAGSPGLVIQVPGGDLLSGSGGGGGTTYTGTGGTSVDGTVISSSIYASLDSSYVVVSADAQNYNERVITAGPGIVLTDGGPGSTLAVSASLEGQFDLNYGWSSIALNPSWTNLASVTDTWPLSSSIEVICVFNLQNADPVGVGVPQGYGNLMFFGVGDGGAGQPYSTAQQTVTVPQGIDLGYPYGQINGYSSVTSLWYATGTGTAQTIAGYASNSASTSSLGNCWISAKLIP